MMINSLLSELLNLINREGKIKIEESMKYFSSAYKALRFHFTDIEVSTISEEVYYNNKKKKIEITNEFSYPDDPKNPIILITVYDTRFEKYYFFVFRSDFDNQVTILIDFLFDKEVTIDNKKIKYNIPCKWILFVFNNEVDMLIKYAEFVNSTKPYMITGWYIEDYDVPYIIRRYERLNIKERALLSPDGRVWCVNSDKNSIFNRHNYTNHIEGINIFDMLWGYEYLFGKHSDGNGLGRTGLRHIGIDKISKEIGKESWYFNDFILPEKGKILTSTEMDNVNENGFLKFIYYGFIDVLLLKMLEEKCSILLSFFYMISFTCGEWAKLHMETTLHDSAALNFKDPYIFLQSKRGRERERIKGAEVLFPPPGFHYGYMIVMDLSREYPNIIRGANLGEDTYIEEKDKELWKDKDVVKLGNGNWFRKDVISFMSNYVSLFFKLRNSIEEIWNSYDVNSELHEIWGFIRQKVKDLINTIYGWMTNPHTRIYHLPSAESITYLGRDLMAHNSKYQKVLAKKLFKNIHLYKERVIIDLIYGDTDSIFIWINVRDLDFVIKIGYYMERYLNKSYDIFCEKHGMFRQYTSIAFESVYMNMFFPPRKIGSEYGKKKNYTALKVWGDGKKLDPPKFIMKGLSGKKSNSPMISSDIQKNLYMKGCLENSKTEILSWLRQMVTFSKNAMTPKEDGSYDMNNLIKCGIPHSFNIDPFEYRTNDASVHFVKYVYENFGIRYKQGDTIMYFYIKKVTNPWYPDTHVFGFDPENPSFPSYFVIDIEKMLRKTIYLKIKDIIPFFDIEWEEVIDDYTKKDLMDFF